MDDVMISDELLDYLAEVYMSQETEPSYPFYKWIATLLSNYKCQNVSNYIEKALIS